ATVGDLRRELEAWRPDARLDALPPLLSDDEPDEEVTMVQIGLPASVRAALEAPVRRAPRPPRPPSVAPPAAAEDVGLLPTLALEAPKLPSLSAESPGFDDDEKTLALKPGALSPAQLAALTAPPAE